MRVYPAKIRRCQHIRTNGTQCGSPALRNEAFCYYHGQSRPERVEVRGDGGQASGEVLVPVFEDASSIQVVVRQVAILVLQGKIDQKKAGLVLYALQIASSNLKRMDEEKPRPAQVVVDREKVAETPMGMTPWSGRAEGHEPEYDAVGFQGEVASKLKRQVCAIRERYEMHGREARRLAREMKGYLAHDPELSYEELRRNMGIIAQHMEEYLVG
jgi:hypothetical protein